MASRTFSKSLRAASRQLATPAVQQRAAYSVARSALRAAVTARPAVAAGHQQVRGVKTIDFAGSKEDVYGKLFLNHSACPFQPIGPSSRLAQAKTNFS